MCDSLRTIDQTKQYSLLKDVHSIQKKKMLKRNVIKPTENQNGCAFTVENLISKKEAKEIIENVTKNEFMNLKTLYNDIRDSSRQVILDKQLSTLLWKRLNNLIKEEQLKYKFKPFGFQVSGFWEPYSINECFRISKYESPSNGFQPHFDNPYTKEIDEKSIFSLIIYLNDDYEGGETTIYEENLLDLTEEIEKETFDGITVKDEIKMNNGIKKYKSHIIKPEIGKGLIFNHQFLHSGDPMKKGVKYILRTDIIFQKSVSFQSNFHSTLYKKCLEMFREAQNQELNKKLKNQMNFMKNHYLLEDIFQTNSDFNFINLEDCWLLILSFLPLNSYTNISITCSTILKYVNIHKKRIWSTIHTELFKDENIESINENDWIKKSELFIPKVIEKKGISSSFHYNDVQWKFFNAHKEGCLRVISMYSLVLLSQTINVDTFIAEYDPESGLIKRVPLKWLLICAFYQLPCSGKYFNIYETNETDIREHFDKKEKRNFGITPHYDDEDEVCELVYIDENEIKIDISPDEYKFEDIEDLSIKDQSNQNETRKLFESYVDKSYFTKISNGDSINFIELSEIVGNEMKLTTPNKSGFTSISYFNGTRSRIGCFCDYLYDRTGTMLILKYNSLICDFEKQQMKITPFDPQNIIFKFNHDSNEKYIVNISEITDFKNFFHAGCHCGPGAYKTTFEKYSEIRFLKNFELNLIGISVHENKVLIAEYSGVNSF
eukprot:gene7120-11283_t